MRQLVIDLHVYNAVELSKTMLLEFIAHDVHPLRV